MPDISANQTSKQWIRHAATSEAAQPWYCSRPFHWAALLVIALFVVGEGVVGILFRDNDFEVHRNLGQLFLDKSVYQNQAIQYPPARIMLNALPALLPYRVSRAVFYVLALAALGWTLAAWRRLADRAQPFTGPLAFAAAAFTLIVAVTYIQRDLDDCGLQLFLLFFLTAALVALEAGKALRCGAWLALATIYKLTPLLFFPYLCWKRQWRAAAWMAIFIVGWSLVPALWIGWDGNIKAHQNWLTCIKSCLGSTDPAENHIEPPNHRNQSLMMALTRLVQTYPPGHPLYLDHPLFVQFGDLDPEVAKKVVLGLLLLFAAVLAWRCRKAYLPSDQSSGILPEWAGLTLLAAILSPICWLQHMVLVIPVVYLLVRAALEPGAGLKTIEDIDDYESSKIDTRVAQLPPLPLYSGGEGRVRGVSALRKTSGFCTGSTPPHPDPLPPSTGGEGARAQEVSDEALFSFSSAKPGVVLSWRRFLFFLVAMIMIFAGQRDLLGHGLFMVLMSYKIHAWGALLALGLVLTLRDNRATMISGKTHHRAATVSADVQASRLPQ